MRASATAATLLINPTTACPRCNGRRVLGLAVNIDSSFAWHECEECRHLWAIPRGWTPHPEPHVLPSPAKRPQ
jgi:hypothetical protein